MSLQQVVRRPRVGCSIEPERKPRGGFVMVAVAALLTAPSGCVASGPATAPAASPAPTAKAPAVALTPRPPLSADETAMIPRLQEHVQKLVEIGERNPDHPWELAGAADYIAQKLEGIGFPVERVGYEVAGVAAQNLAVTIPGGELADEVWLVGAHYDSARGDRGEEHNATGVAALLELARMMREAKSSRTLKLVAFSLSEPPFAQTADMGSARYLKQLTETKEKVVSMINLDGVGALGEGQGALGPVHVRLGVAEGGGLLARKLAEELDEDPFTIETVPETGAGGSDAWAFAQHGIPAVSVEGAGPQPAVDYDGMTRLVMKLRFALADFVGETPTNDEMLTPEVQGVR